ncbi:MAG: DNA-binding protein WhiA [Clostridia bacterium]|nr:DNA-binding protein WhiA [Clostridia bacterium]
MSFSLSVKQEVSSSPFSKECCLRAELAAFVRTNGSMELGIGGIKVRFDVERLDTANRIYGIINRLYKADAQIDEKEYKRLGKKHTYSVKIGDPETAEKLLNDAGVLLKDEDGYTMETGLPRDMLKLTCCQKSYLKGAFQGSGSVSDPKKEYRLEFASRDTDTDSHIQKILHSMDIPFHTSVRREWVITYISDAENIIKLLALMGAHRNLLDMENVIVLKGIRNDINRKVNLETANLKKISTASMQQIEAINKLIEAGIYDKLPLKIRLAADARMENKEATLEEIADILDISKSGANHRMRKIAEYAQNCE